MLNKNDPLIGAVQEVMKKNQAERDAVRLVNEKFGVADRKALPHERQGEWDAAYKTVLTEGVEALDEAKLPKPPTSVKAVLALGSDERKSRAAAHEAEAQKHKDVYGKHYDKGSHGGPAAQRALDRSTHHEEMADRYLNPKSHFKNLDNRRKETEPGVHTMDEEILNELSPETLENYKNKRTTQVHAIIRNMINNWQRKRTPQGASDFIINSAKKAAKHAENIKLAGDKIEGKKGVVAAKRPKKGVVPANRPKKRLEEEALDEEKIKMYGIPNKVKPKRGRLGTKDKNAINVTNDLFRRMKELEKGNVKAAGNVTRAQIKKMQSEEALDEKLVGNQHRIDANKNGRVDGHDFKMLRAKKKPMEEDVTSPSSMGIKKPDYAPAGTTPDYAKPKEQTVNRAAKTSLPPGTMKEENLKEAGMMPKGIIPKKVLKLKAIMKSKAAEKRAWDDRGWGPGPDFRKDVDTMQRMDKVAKRLEEKKLTSAEKSKREEVATAMERENPGMPMAKKMRIATATAKRVAEENEGFNNRHGLSVTASAEKQAVVDQLNEKVGNLMMLNRAKNKARLSQSKMSPDVNPSALKNMRDARTDAAAKAAARTAFNTNLPDPQMSGSGRLRPPVNSVVKRQQNAADIQTKLAAQRQQSGDIASRPQSSVALQRQQSGDINTSLRTPPGQRTTTTAAQAGPGQSGSTTVVPRSTTAAQAGPGQSGSTTVVPRSTTAAQASTGKQIGGARPALVAKNTPTAPKKITSTGNPNAAGSGGNVGAANPVSTSSASVKAASPAAKPKPKRIGQTRYQRDAAVTGPGGRLG